MRSEGIGSQDEMGEKGGSHQDDLVLLEAVWHVALELSAASASKDEGKAPVR